MTHDPDWTAPKHGHDFRDDDILLVTGWLRSFVLAADMERRLGAVRERLTEARSRIIAGERAELFDSSDLAAWYLFQAEAYAKDRRFWVPEEAMRIVPIMKRLGIEFALLLQIEGIAERAARLMTSERRQPDAGLFEMLVALAYRRAGWTRVDFVPEERGRRRTPDLQVSRPGRSFAVECKRMMPSVYEQKERQRGEDLARPIHALCLELGASVVVEVIYNVELTAVPDEYLIAHVRERIDRRDITPWSDEFAEGQVRPVAWSLTHKVLSKDDVYFGSSRMIELMSGTYLHNAEHSIAARWRPAPERPFYAEAIYQASVVTWFSGSTDAILRKARHFKSTLSQAEEQLPSDRPGVVHVGFENTGGPEVDSARHFRNWLEAKFFEPRDSRLRWVYAHYFAPEATTRPNESWAITESVVPFRIGRHKTQWPLPNQLLLTAAEQMTEGVHWDRFQSQS
ncbi:hypothetical protein OVA11_04890 [Caulobacter sp. SL161]|uniref:hypothetical protein n=1 Tax=Caulobacter sp. SL161 TaxID=2995156 RepID=UPI0022760076|nr:hypothetical protein [Caulobacter sp. SL161]MCY1646429.1 hypothetical protein [Caulobacter sp. SL161]